MFSVYKLNCFLFLHFSLGVEMSPEVKWLPQGTPVLHYCSELKLAIHVF